MRQVQIKGTGQTVGFPDGMTDDEMRAALQREFSESEMMPSQQSMAPSEMLRPQAGQHSSYEPTMAEKLKNKIGGALYDSGIISDRYGAQRIGDNVSMMAEALPVVGDVMGGDDLGRAIQQGDGTEMLLAGVGALPIVGEGLQAGGKILKSKLKEGKDFKFGEGGEIKWTNENLNAVGLTPNQYDYQRKPEYFRNEKDIESEVILMSPDQYVSEAAKILDTPVADVLKTRTDFDYLRNAMDEGQEIGMPYLDYKKGGQEGLHRALIAKEKGDELIPVQVIKSVSGENRVNVTDMKKPNDTAGILSGEIDSLPMDQPSRRARATEQGFKTSAFSGSTHNINEFDASIANPESDFGRGIYASSSIDDVNANYARSDGADLTGRIEQEKERLINDIEDDPEAFGVSVEDFEDDPDGVAERIAKERLVGDAGGGVVYPLEINTDDFVVINGRDSTKLEQPDYRDEAESTIDRADYDDDDEFEDAIMERVYELESESTESLSKRVSEALNETDIYQDEEAMSNIMGAIQDEMMEGELNLGDLDAAIRENVMDAYDDNGEMLSAGEVSRQVMQNLGFKGVADKTVNKKFGSQRQYGQSMEGMDEDTIHYIVFPEHENLIRSKNAKFDPKKKSSKNILASVGGATVAYGVAKNQDEETKSGTKFKVE